MFQGIIKLLSLILISTFYFTESMGKYQWNYEIIKNSHTKWVQVFIYYY